MALKRKLLPVIHGDGGFYSLQETLVAEIKNFPELRKALIKKYEHALTTEAFYLKYGRSVQ